MSENNNMKLYNIWREVPDEAKKAAKVNGRDITDINPMWRIQMLTEVFGVCGFGWYYTIDRQWTETYGNIVKAFCNVSLYVKVDGEWSKPIQGNGGNFFTMQSKNGIVVSDECYKMALTDALSIACKSLGIGANVWFDKAETKYTQNLERLDVASDHVAPAETTEDLLEEARLALSFAKTKKDCTDVYNNPKFVTLKPSVKGEMNEWYKEVNEKYKSCN